MKHLDPPNVLRLNPETGQLYCVDGRDTATYLREWAARANIDEETPVALLRRDQFIALQDDAFLARHWPC